MELNAPLIAEDKLNTAVTTFNARELDHTDHLPPSVVAEK